MCLHQNLNRKSWFCHIQTIFIIKTCLTLSMVNYIVSHKIKKKKKIINENIFVYQWSCMAYGELFIGNNK